MPGHPPAKDPQTAGPARRAALVADGTRAARLLTLVADETRAARLLALLDDRARPSGESARHAGGVAASTVPEPRPEKASDLA